MASLVSPLFESGTNTLPVPAICSTALTRPSANPACPAIIARAEGAVSSFASASASPRCPGLFVIFLQIFPDVPRRSLAHSSDESLVEHLCRIYPGISEQVIEGDHFGDDGDVLSRIERDSDERNVDAKDCRRIGVESCPIDHRILVPLLEPNDHLDSFLLPHRANAEDRRYVDEADAPDFHVMPLQLVAATDQNVVAATCRDHQIVRDEPVTTLDEIENTFRFSDPAFSSEEESDTEDIRERSMQGGYLGKLSFENRLDAPVELRCFQLCPDQRRTSARRGLLQTLGKILSLGHDDGGHVEAEEARKYSRAVRRIERGEICNLRFAQYLNPLGDESVYVAREGQSRTRDVRIGNRLIDSDPVSDVLETEAGPCPFEKLSNCERLAHALVAFPTTRARSARRRSALRVRI